LRFGRKPTRRPRRTVGRGLRLQPRA
jgi:hypothetical protein